MTFIEPDVIDDEGAVAEGILAGLADRIDGFEPSEGHIETPLAESVAVAIATAITVMQDTVSDAYLGFGLRILNIARGAAGVASAVSTWTLDPDNPPTVIEAGVEVQATAVGGGTLTFIVAEDTVVPPATTTVTGVVLVAVESGPDYNGAANPATSTDLVGVQAVSIDAPAVGGADAEDPDAYVDRAADRATRMHTIPITPSDHAAFATDLTVVERAAAVNLLNPADPGVESTGHITLYPVDANGDALGPTDVDALIALFASIDRPLNVTVHVEAPTYVDVTVAVTVRAAAADAATDLEGRVQAAIESLIDKATWDADPAAPGGWAQVRSTALTIFDVSAAIDDLDDVLAVTAVSLNGAGDPVPLPAPVSIPVLTGTPTVTIT